MVLKGITEVSRPDCAVLGVRADWQNVHVDSLLKAIALMETIVPSESTR